MEENPWVVTAISALVVGIGVLAAGVTVVTAATAAWNAVLLANPAGLVVAGVTALVSALTFLAFSMGSADAETRELTKSIKESKAAYDDLTESMEPGTAVYGLARFSAEKCTRDRGKKRGTKRSYPRNGR